MPKLTDQVVRAAIDGFTAQKAHLNERIAELRAMLNGGPAKPAAAEEPAARRRMSAATRRRISLAQKARLAKFRGESKLAAPAQ